MVVKGYNGEVGVTKLEIRNIGTVDLELNLIVNTTSATKNVYSRRISSREILDWVIEVDLLDLST